MLPKELQQLINQLPLESQVVIKAVVVYFEQKLKEQEEVIQLQALRIKELEDQISKNSRNSSKPPSTDEFKGIKKPPKSLRSKTNRKPGGQQGHKGDTLKMVEQADYTEFHEVNTCIMCENNLTKQKSETIERRQVYDIPPIELKVTEHQSEVKTCTCCGHVNRFFPIGVNHYVQYGANLKGMMLYLQDYQLLPYGRCKELVKDFFNHDLSTGTLYNIGDTAYERLNPFKDRIKELLTYCEVVGFDETGCNIKGKNAWLHSYSTDKHAYYEVHSGRGSEAMKDIGILPDFNGIAVHDFWQSYYKFCCLHALCNAHLLRDLIFIKERFKQSWSEDLIRLLLKMKAAKEKAIDKGKTTFSKATINNYKAQYQKIIQQGLKKNLFEPPTEKSRGRYKKSPPRNVLERLDDFQDDVLRFFLDFRVPFDNNFSERDIRMMKVKQKISGGFRSLKGAKIFTRIRSYIVTARKQKVNPLRALTNLFEDNTVGLSLTSDLIHAE